MRLITNDEMELLASYMNEEIREEIHFKFAPCSNELFCVSILNANRNL